MESVIGDFANGGREIDSLACGMAELVKELADHPRVTLRQALFFVVLAAGNLNDRHIILRDVRHMTTDADDVRLFGESVICRTYTIFLEETEGLGWLKQVADKADRRAKRLVLTPKGEAVAARIALAMS